ncbi:MAG: esterase-like activity of phytase family protein [Cyanobacteria bacterium SID2]|nr:esterase-like activity of phytase family protein [Cyanobacteria bacterium SID2]MBP0004422.1 esterase-like activity of phytase family protein [Cyanobacteria bacterium SBC]
MILGGLLSISIVGLLVGCGLPQVSAETRLFLDLTVDYLDEYQLETIEVGGTPVGGLSALAYDRQQGKFYALSDDRGFESPARFYTLSIELDPDRVQIDRVTVENVTLLTDEAGQPFAPGSIDPEGLALSPDGTLFVSSEGVASEGIAPFIGEFDRATGQLIRRLPLPDYFRPDAAAEAQTLGVRDNLGFEALTVGGTGSGEPYRVFAATESSLLQDTDPDHRESPDSRLLHYIVVGDRSQLIAEHLYQLDPPPSVLTVSNGLVELLSLDRASPFASRGGYFLSLERTFGASGFGAKLFQVSIARATDVSTLTRASGQLDGIESLPKQLLLDLSELELSLDNLEGMTFGPQLQDGTQSLILVSDNNFRDEQITQFLLCRLYESR